MVKLEYQFLRNITLLVRLLDFSKIKVNKEFRNLTKRRFLGVTVFRICKTVYYLLQDTFEISNEIFKYYKTLTNKHVHTFADNNFISLDKTNRASVKENT